MQRTIAFLTTAILTATFPICESPATTQAGPNQTELDKQRCPKPKRFALVFSFGYGPDAMPPEEARFDDLLGKIKQVGFNTIHCTYSDRRLALCKKHDIQMMVHLLEDEHHVYKSPGKAKELCEKLRGNPTVWGYNIWNDIYGKTTPGRVRDVNQVRTWDPTHPAYTGTYRADGMRGLHNPDVFGYYDFHWKRRLDLHFPHLLAYNGWAKERNAWFYAWLSATSGQPGDGNFHRSLWSANTSIACGLKGIQWFLGSDLMNEKTLEWKERGKDIARVHAEIAPLAGELVKLDNPSAIYATPLTKTANNTPLAEGKKEMLPAGLSGIPRDFWLQAQAGEFVMGVCKDDQKRDAVFLANHNAYAAQKAALKLLVPMQVSLFNRRTGKWEPVEAQEGVFSVALTSGGGELLRFEK